MNNQKKKKTLHGSLRLGSAVGTLYRNSCRRPKFSPSTQAGQFTKACISSSEEPNTKTKRAAVTCNLWCYTCQGARDRWSSLSLSRTWTRRCVGVLSFKCNSFQTHFLLAFSKASFSEQNHEIIWFTELCAGNWSKCREKLTLGYPVPDIKTI